MNEREREREKALSLCNTGGTHRESLLGGHFTEQFNCPRRGFLRYIIGLRPIQTEEYFAFGSVIHDALEILYKHQVPELALEISDILMDKAKERFPKESFAEYKAKAREAISTWTEKFLLPDLEDFDLVGTELEIVTTLPNGFVKTLRLDRLSRHKETQRLVIFDTKTTKGNITWPIKSVSIGDQGISYVHGVLQEFGELPLGIYVDVIQSRVLKSGIIVDVMRSSLLTYSKYALAQYEIGQIGLMSELAQKVKAYKDGTFPAELLFYRQPEKCTLFGCPFESICRKNIKPGFVPEGFERDEWAEQGLVEDALSEKEGLADVLRLYCDKAEEGFA